MPLLSIENEIFAIICCKGLSFSKNLSSSWAVEKIFERLGEILLMVVFLIAFCFKYVTFYFVVYWVGVCSGFVLVICCFIIVCVFCFNLNTFYFVKKLEKAFVFVL